MDWEILWSSLDLAMFFLLPVLLFAAVYIYYKEFPGFLEACGMTAKEVGLLLIGSVVGLLGEVPVVIWGKSVIAINVGGALIPIVLSAYLLRKKILASHRAAAAWYAVIAAFAVLFAYSLISGFFLRHSASLFIAVNNFAAHITVPYLFIFAIIILDAVIGVSLLYPPKRGYARDFLLLLIGVEVISLITWWVSYIIPDLGIASDFPFYILPGGFAALMAVVIYFGDIAKAAPFAYISATLGTLIGADISRIPILFREMGTFAGSIGGAGPLDMVFLSGLIAISLTFLFAPRRLRALAREKSWMKLSERKKESLMESADAALDEKRFADAVHLTVDAVNEKITALGKRTGAAGDTQTIIEKLGVHPYKAGDYRMLSGLSAQNDFPEDGARRAVKAAKLLIQELERVENRLYATTLQRVSAFLIDAMILMAVILPPVIIGISNYNNFSVKGVISIDPRFIAILMLAWSSQLIYFTVCEWLWGQSLGKRILKIMVVSEEQTRCGFVQIFTRNVLRFIETFTLYLMSIALVMGTMKKQRIGDMVAKTVVIRL